MLDPETEALSGQGLLNAFHKGMGMVYALLITDVNVM